VAMRARMRTELDRSREGLFDIKQGGARLVDLELLLQYLVLRGTAATPALAAPPDSARQLAALREPAVLPDDAFTALRDAHAGPLGAGRRCSLDRPPRMVPVDEAVARPRAAIRAAWAQYL